jgi:hypothetical protein
VPYAGLQRKINRRRPHRRWHFGRWEQQRRGRFDTGGHCNGRIDPHHRSVCFWWELFHRGERNRRNSGCWWPRRYWRGPYEPGRSDSHGWFRCGEWRRAIGWRIGPRRTIVQWRDDGHGWFRVTRRWFRSREQWKRIGWRIDNRGADIHWRNCFEHGRDDSHGWFRGDRRSHHIGWRVSDRGTNIYWRNNLIWRRRDRRLNVKHAYPSNRRACN